MKIFQTLHLFLFLSLLISSTSCRKKNVEISELAKLPAETHTGANTFGCLLNGKAYLPHRSIFGAPSYQCNYIYMDGGYYFTLTASQRFYNPDSLTAIFIQGENLALKEGDVIPLTEFFTQGKVSGTFSKYFTTPTMHFRTNSTVKGELSITYLNEVKRIVAGTFSFDAVNDKGEKVEVRNGRFDMQYTN